MNKVFILFAKAQRAALRVNLKEENTKTSRSLTRDLDRFEAQHEAESA